MPHPCHFGADLPGNARKGSYWRLEQRQSIITKPEAGVSTRELERELRRSTDGIQTIIGLAKHHAIT
jgi:hypothetical protein